MASLGMLELDPADAPPDEPPQRLVGEGDLDVPATVAPFDGLCETLVGPLDRVIAGQIVAIVTDPLTGERPRSRRSATAWWSSPPRGARRQGRQPRRARPARVGDRLGADTSRPAARRSAAPDPFRHRRPTVSRGQHPMITVRDTGLVYRNPRPELHSKHTWHPTIVRFDDGEWLVTFDIAAADVAHRLPDLADPLHGRRPDLVRPRPRLPRSARSAPDAFRAHRTDLRRPR